MVNVQAIIFKLDKITKDEIIKFLLNFSKNPIKYHLTNNNTLRVRYEKPEQFKKFRTKKINDAISMVIGL